MLDCVVMVTIPLAVSFVSVPALRRFRFFSNLSVGEKLVISLTAGTALLIVILSLWGMLLPGGFRAFSVAVYVVALGSALWGAWENRRPLVVALRTLPRMAAVTLRGDKLTLVLWTVVAAYVIKALLFLFLRPVIDSDVVVSYLPFARTAYLSDHIPSYNLYDTGAIMVPPVGGWILYSWIYSVSGSIFTESFRLLMFPFLMGSLAMTYLLGRTVADTRTARLGVIVFALLPLHDQVLFESVLFPDVMFAFLSLIAFYFMVRLFYDEHRSHEVVSYSLIIGLAMGTSMWLKFQGVILYYFLVLFYILHFPAKRWVRFFLLGLFAVPAIWSLDRFAGIGFLKPSLFLTVVSAVLWAALLVWLAGNREAMLKRTRFPLSGLVVIVGSLHGFVWLIRNQLLFGEFTTLSWTQSAAVAWVVGIRRAVVQAMAVLAHQQPAAGLTRAAGLTGEGQAPFVEWALLLLPALGTLWLLPKLVGLWRSTSRNRPPLLLLWIGTWYLFWLFYLGGASERYLLPALPALAVVIATGVRSLVAALRLLGTRWDRLARRYLSSKAALWFVAGMAILSLSQSLFLSWNAGIIAYGYAGLHRVVELRESADGEPVLPAPEAPSEETGVTATVGWLKGLLPLEWRRTIGRVAQPVMSSLGRPAHVATVTAMRLGASGRSAADHLATVLNARSELYSRHALELLLYGILATPLLMGLVLLVARFGQRVSLRSLRGNLCLSALLFAALLGPYLLVFCVISEGDIRRFGEHEVRKVYSYWGQSITTVPYLLQHADPHSVVLFCGVPTGLSYYTGLRVLNVQYGYDLAELRPVFEETDVDATYRFFVAQGIDYVILDTRDTSARYFQALRTVTSVFDILDDERYFSLKLEPNDESVWALYEIVK